MGVVHRLIDYQRGEVTISAGKQGRETGNIRRRALARNDGKLFLLPRRRRIGRMGPAKILEFRRAT